MAKRFHHRSEPRGSIALVAFCALAAACASAVSCAPKDFIVYPLFEYNTATVRWDDSGATAFLPAAAVCMRCDLSPEVNRASMQAYVERIKAEHADVRLILFSETNLGWYLNPEDPAGYQRRMAEAVDGPTMLLMKSLAQANDLYIGYGYAESSGDLVYNSFALIDDSGTLIGNHRKAYMAPTMDDVDGFTAGSSPTTAYIDGIKVGMEICMDFSSIRLAKAYASDPEIKIILSPLADANANPPIFADIRLRNKWFIFANRIGTEGETVFPGWYGIYDPAGAPRAYSRGSEGYLFMKVGVYQ